MNTKTRPLTIFFGDLTHDTVVLVSDTMPINIGGIAEYALKLFGGNIATRLFKYPASLIDAIQASCPDMVVLSNYSWNSHLSRRVCEIAKELSPAVITVQGGTNFPHEAEGQLDFLKSRPAIDFHTIMEAEIGFANIVTRVLESNHRREEIFSSPIDGVVFVEPESRLLGDPKLIVGASVPRIKDLDEIPSPYLSGLMDGFFDGRLLPFLSTNRGCPFKCSFCHTGADYFQKTHTFSIERTIEEIAYIGPRIAPLGVDGLHIADTNYGMYPRDREITKALLESHNKYGWPSAIMATTGKNNKARVIDITKMLGTMFSVNMSVQSMSPNVLKNVRRSNIALDDYVAINRELTESGRNTKAELIIPLPGETKKSFLDGLESVLDTGTTTTTIYTLMMLYGTEFQSPKYRQKYCIEGRHRIIPSNFGNYGGQATFDVEEVAVSTNTLTFQDYLDLRGVALLVESLLNGRPFDEVFSFAESFGVKKVQILERLIENIQKAPREVAQLYADFLRDTQSELWSSESELVSFYQQPENYKRLENGEDGHNLIYTYKVVSIVFNASGWAEYLKREVAELISEKNIDQLSDSRVNDQLAALCDFCELKLHGVLRQNASDSPISKDFHYDILSWLDNKKSEPLEEYYTAEPIEYSFEFTVDQLENKARRKNNFNDTISQLSKLVTRIRNMESEYRVVRVGDDVRGIYSGSNIEEFTKYTLAN